MTDSIPQNVFASPDFHKDLVADEAGFSLMVDHKKVAWPEGKNFDSRGSEISWSPTSTMFFINNGNGSGLDGWTIHVFYIIGSQVVDNQEINAEIVRLFRLQVKCFKDAVDPNVRGLGWSKDGALLFAFAQTTVSESCGTQGEFRGAAVTTTNGSVSRFYSESETRAHFHQILPYNMR